MRVETQEILDQALQLPTGEKAHLIDELLASLDKPDGVTDALWRKEVENRITAYNAGNLRTVSLKEMLAKYHK